MKDNQSILLKIKKSYGTRKHAQGVQKNPNTSFVPEKKRKINQKSEKHAFGLKKTHEN